jgi:hypothetical protein
MSARSQTSALVALIAALQVADIVTTNLALRVPTVSEVNPIMAFSQAHLGALWPLPKLALAGVLMALFLQWGRPRPAAIAAALWVLVVGTNIASIIWG